MKPDFLRSALTILIVLFAITHLASAMTISGKILDRETGESIPGVSVLIEGTTRGVAANVEGYFALPDLPPGSITLVFSAVGYKSLRKPLDLDSTDLQLTFKMIPAAVEMKTVEIVAEAKAEGERTYSPKVAQYHLETRELAKLPQVIETDLFRSLQIVPGVLTTSDFSSELNIWGGSSDENLILLNGVEVYKPTHLGGLFSVFNTDAVKDVKLIKGGFGAKYGGRLSAVLDIADREGNRNKTEGKVGLSLLSSHATLEGPLPRGSWLIAGRRTYVDFATKLLKNSGAIKDDFPYYFYDLNGKITRDFPNGDRISPSFYTGRDFLNLVSNSQDKIHMVWGNTTFSVPYVRIFHRKLFSHNVIAGSFFDSDFKFTTADNWSRFENKIQDFTAKSDLTWFASSRNTLDFGVGLKNIHAKLAITASSDTFHNGTYDGWLLSSYLSDDYRPLESITLTPGLRVDHNTLSGYTAWQPRFQVKKELTDVSSISAAVGLYDQAMQQVTFGDNVISVFNSYILLDRSFKPNKAYHYALTYENDFEGPLKLSAGAYYKDFRRVIEWNPMQVPKATDKLGNFFAVGKGYAYGADVMLQGDWERFSFLWGYSLGRARRSFPFWDNGLVYPPTYDRLHNLNFFVSRKVRKRGSLEVRFNYGSGQAMTKAEGVYSPGLDLPPEFYEPGRKHGHRLPAYHRLDIAYRLRYEKKHWTFCPYFEVFNVYNRQNIFSLEYDLRTNPAKEKTIGQLPFLPSLGFTAEF